MSFTDLHPVRNAFRNASTNELLLTAYGYTGNVSSLGELFGFHCTEDNSVKELDQRRFLASAELMARALEDGFRNSPMRLSSPASVREYLRLKLGGRKIETFAVLWLDSQNGLLGYEEIFRGTLTQTSVYPREIVRGALHQNAAAVVFAHNHPSGVAEPSRADEALTQTMKSALALVDVRVLDHFIVTSDACRSMAEMGLV